METCGIFPRVKNLHSDMRGDIPALAERFGVTQEAMAYRLRQLGL